LADRDKVERSINPRAKSEIASQEIDNGLNLSPNSPITFHSRKNENQRESCIDHNHFGLISNLIIKKKKNG